MLLWIACATSQPPAPAVVAPMMDDDHAIASIPPLQPGQEEGVFGGGCFWCLEADFDKLPGVVSTTSGFAGGSEPNPTYEEVSAHRTHHTEVVRVVWDSSKLNYDQVLTWFWQHIDPTDDGGQFCDRGSTYAPVIFAVSEAQRVAAEASKAALEAEKRLPAPIVVPVVTGATFYAAERYHQDFHTKDPTRYSSYRAGCGRDARVAELWRTPSL